MERLIGKKVKSEQFGEGTITKADKAGSMIFITVYFSRTNESKRFAFPHVLGNSLNGYGDELQRIADDMAREKEEAIKKEKKEKKPLTEEELRQKKISDTTVEEAKEIIRNIDRDQVFELEEFRIFKVHQGKTFDQECKGGFLWAPATGVFYHQKMTEVRPGDIIFHYKKGALVAVGEALSNCFSYPQPSALYGHGWGPIGYRVDVRYQELKNPLPLTPHHPTIIANKASYRSSFNCKGGACQGYLFDLEIALARYFKDEIIKLGQPTGVEKVLKRIR